MEGRTGVISCLARVPDGLQLLHHESRLAYCLLRCASLVLWDVVRRKKGGLLSTRQWICEGHRVSSDVLFFHSQNLRRRHILRHLTGGRFSTPPVLQRLLILIIIRQIDNSVGWSCREVSGSEIASQSTKNGVRIQYLGSKLLRPPSRGHQPGPRFQK